MVQSNTKEEMTNHIVDLDCQIEYLEYAIKRNMVEKEEEYRLNSLLVKRACCKQELQEIDKKKNLLELLPGLNYFSRQPKRISDYF